MKNIFDYNQFLNEGRRPKQESEKVKKEPKALKTHSKEDEIDEVKKEVKELLKTYFAKASRVERGLDIMECDEEGFPKKLRFVVDENDYTYNDEDFEMDYSKNVHLKRKFDVKLEFIDKEIEDDKYIMEYDVIIKDVDIEKFLDKEDEEDVDDNKELSDDEIEEDEYADVVFGKKGGRRKKIDFEEDMPDFEEEIEYKKKKK